MAGKGAAAMGLNGGGGLRPSKGKGGAKGKQQAAPAWTQPQKSLPALEAEFAKQANKIYDDLLNLNVSMTQVVGIWDKALALRSKILQMYGVPASEAAVPKPKVAVAAGKGAGGKGAMPAPMQALMDMMQQSMGGGWAGAAGGAAASFDPADFKGKLNSLAAKRAKRPMTKGDLLYTVTDDPAGNGYWATLSSPELLAQEYCSAEASPSKKGAEHAAAKAALEAEFAAEMGPAAVSGGGKKRKADALTATAASTPNDDPKSKLIYSAQCLLGRSVTKADIIYEMREFEQGGATRYQATVNLTAYEPQRLHQGADADTKKQAEFNAAEAAVAALASVVAPIDAERKAKKAKVAAEKLELWKAQREAKKGAKKAVTDQAA